MKIFVPFGEEKISVELPDGIDVLSMKEPGSLLNPQKRLFRKLREPIGSDPLYQIALKKILDAEKNGNKAKACIVVSDNTRPVPYAGENGILKPILQILLEAGADINNICILIACGTHRLMSNDEILCMLGKDIVYSGVKIVNHDCWDESQLVKMGMTARGTSVKINKLYAEADIKILTGLVESHFMAGASGGRKSVCPGILGKDATYVFHGPELMAHPNSRDLVLEGNPVHEEALEAAQIAGVDFIVNVTLNSHFEITGIFCGDLEKAHAEAVRYLKSYVAISIEKPYDMVLTHGGFVAVNHYQSAKAAVAAIAAVKKNGVLLQVANNHDATVIGSERYRMVLSLLKLVGAETFEKLLFSKEWCFIPEQWQVQLWTRVFNHIGVEHYIYYAPQLDAKDWRDVPGVDGRKFLPKDHRSLSDFEKTENVIKNAVQAFLEQYHFTQADIKSGKCRIAFLNDGPYGIPIIE